MEWIVTVEADLGQLDTGTLVNLSETSGAAIGYDQVTGHTTATFDVQASTVRQATLAGLARAVLPTNKLTAVRVITPAQLERELAEPLVPDLVGVSEAAQILGVARQRIGQLAQDHDDFPAPVASIAAGPIYTRIAIEAFGRRWERKRTGRPRKAS